MIMNSQDQERAKIVSVLLTELNSVHVRAERAWQALLKALIPVWESLEATPADLAEDLSEACTWTDAIQAMDASVAGDVSHALARFSEALTQHYRTVTPRDHRVSQALSLIYLDVQRPLWVAYPDLRPFDVPG
jgi:hypothetical protein